MPLKTLLGVYDQNFRFKQYPKTVLAPLAEAQAIVDKLIAAKAAIEGDRGLTSEGKDTAKVKVGVAALNALATWVKPKLAGLDADLAAQKAALPTVPTPDANAVTEMRAKLQPFTPQERAVLYNSASAQEQQLMEAAHAAAGRAPSKSANGLEWTHMLDPVIVTEAVNARLAAAHPEAFQRVNEIGELRDMHQSVATQAAADIRAALPNYKIDEHGAMWGTV
jgi:hypothetical protein